MSLTFLRHCQSEYNVDCNCKNKDCDLTPFGKLQAKQIQGNFDLVICSPLKRCIQTLNNSNVIYKRLEINHECREYRKDICDHFEDEEELIESEEDIKLRVNNFKKYLENFTQENVLVISHSDFIFYFSSIEISGELFGKWVNNGEFLII